MANGKGTVFAKGAYARGVGRRQGDAGGAQREAGGRPGKGGDAVFQLLLQDEREEAARDVAADGLVELVIDRAGLEQALGGSKVRSTVHKRL